MDYKEKIIELLIRGKKISNEKKENHETLKNILKMPLYIYLIKWKKK